ICQPLPPLSPSYLLLVAIAFTASSPSVRSFQSPSSRGYGRLPAAAVFAFHLSPS
ncbi:hypothetical protein S245_045963, partial [Arachis hypogaea]